MAQSTKAPEKPKPKQSELRQRFEKYCKEQIVGIFVFFYSLL